MISISRFLNKQGLDQAEAQSLEIFLHHLHAETSELFWQPTHCTTVPHEVGIANSIRYGRTFSFHFGELIPMRHLRSHFFLTAERKRGKGTLIIDPTGIPAELTDYPDISTITPYFGLAGHAPEPHFTIYSNREPMDDWGTRDLPPGFHP